MIAYPDGIYAVDAEYVRPKLAAVHVMVHAGRAAIVDSGTSHSVPQVLAALATLGVAREAVDWLWLTHVHLDHAGGAGQLMQALPNARVALHPRGAPHMIAPAKLVEASIVVYGAENFAKLYGEILPIDAARVHVTQDGESIDFAGRRIEILHTPGHALHHQAFVDHGGAEGRNIFTGDTFGLCYTEFTREGRALAMPTTSPTQFDPEQLVASIRRVVAVAPQAAYLTHYGRVTDIPRLGANLERLVRRFADIAIEHRTREAIRAALCECMCAEVEAHGCDMSRAQIEAVLVNDLDLNADGLLAWLARRK